MHAYDFYFMFYRLKNQIKFMKISFFAHVIKQKFLSYRQILKLDKSHFCQEEGQINPLSPENDYWECQLHQIQQNEK